MTWLSNITHAMRAFVHRSRVEQELDDEIRFHLEKEVESKVASGMNPEEARYAALRSFGGVEQTKEECRDTHGVLFIKTLWQDFRHGLRLLLKSPGFTIVAVLSLSLGIGANTAIFSVVDAVLLRPLPYPAADRLIMLWSTMETQGLPTSGSAMPNYREWRDQNHVFEKLAAFTYSDFSLSGQHDPERVQGALITPNIFPVLGISPTLGREFLPEEEQYGRHLVVLLSHGFWQRRYASDPQILGQQVKLDGKNYTVVGVMPQSMPFLDNSPRVDLWTPLSFAPDDIIDTRGSHFLRIVGRLKDRVTVEQAQDEVSRIAHQMGEEFPENMGLGGLVVPLQEEFVGDFKLPLFMLLGAVAFVLLVACVNVANLLLARATARTTELAIRTSLGAGRVRLIRQLLFENLPLCLLGGAIGLLLATWGIKVIVPMLPSSLPRYNDIAIDGRVLAFSFLVSMLTILVFGLIPAFWAAKTNVREGLTEGTRQGTTDRRHSRLRDVLVAAEVALALVLLIGATLMVQSFINLRRFDTGFSASNVLSMRLPLPEAKYPVPQDFGLTRPPALTFYDQLLERIAVLPGVQSSGVSTTLPLYTGSGWGKIFSVEGHRAPSSLDQVPGVRYVLVSHDYLSTMGVAVRRGRLFTQRDSADAQQVVVINETLARRFFPNEDALGQIVWMGPPEDLLPPFWKKRLPEGRFTRRTIVGIIPDINRPGPREEAKPEVYAPYQQFGTGGWPNSMMLVVRTTSTPESLMPAIREQISALDTDLPITDVATMEERVSRSLSEPRFNTALLGLFAGLALLLAAVGVYGVMSYTVTQQTHEIGIRRALGAESNNILRLVVLRGLKLAVVGVAIGLPTSFVLMRVLTSQLYGVSATDPITFVAVALLLTGVVAVASYGPARRAARVAPMVALRAE